MSVATDRIVEAVRAVLQQAAHGKGSRPHFVTTYQILERVPAELREELVAEYGAPGQGAGKHYTAASRVAGVVRGMGEVEVRYLDARGLVFDQEEDEDDASVRSGYPVIGIYRLK